jgi:hypothetical protein
VGSFGQTVFAKAAAAVLDAAAPPAVLLCGLRALANFFRWPDSAAVAALQALRAGGADGLEALGERARGADANVRLALATLLLNAANAVLQGRRNDRNAAVMAQCLRASWAGVFAGGDLAGEAARRAAMAVGCVALFDRSLVGVDEVLALARSSPPELAEVLRDVAAVCGAAR